jgi:hypothetical protein
MPESWHEMEKGCYPVMDCIPLIQLYFSHSDKKMAQGLLAQKGFFCPRNKRKDAKNQGSGEY